MGFKDSEQYREFSKALGKVLRTSPAEMKAKLEAEKAAKNSKEKKGKKRNG